MTGENVEERGELRSKIFKLKVFRKDRSSKGNLKTDMYAFQIGSILRFEMNPMKLDLFRPRDRCWDCFRIDIEG